jgi:hypothetical protein
MSRLRRSRLGFIATNRNPTDTLGGTSQAVGSDLQVALRDDIFINAYVAGTNNGQKEGTSYRSRFDWNHDRYGVNVEHLFVGDGFDPSVGFLRRSAFRRSFAQLRFSPRPARMPAIRKFTLQGSGDYITGIDGRVQSTEAQGTFIIETAAGDFVNAEVTRAYERLDVPFEVARNVTVPVGGYTFAQGKVSYTLGTQRPFSGTFTLGHGGFYEGTLSEASYRGRVEFSPQLVAEPTLSFNLVDGPYGRGATNVIGSRVTYTVTPRMFAAALVQYQSRTQSMSTNVRFRWEYKLGSELFVVYSDGRSTLGPNYPELQNRSIVVKLTRLFRW